MDLGDGTNRCDVFLQCNSVFQKKIKVFEGDSFNLSTQFFGRDGNLEKWIHGGTAQKVSCERYSTASKHIFHESLQCNIQRWCLIRRFFIQMLYFVLHFSSENDNKTSGTNSQISNFQSSEENRKNQRSNEVFACKSSPHKPWNPETRIPTKTKFEKDVFPLGVKGNWERNSGSWQKEFFFRRTRIWSGKRQDVVPSKISWHVFSRPLQVSWFEKTAAREHRSFTDIPFWDYKFWKSQITKNSHTPLKLGW